MGQLNGVTIRSRIVRVVVTGGMVALMLGSSLSAGASPKFKSNRAAYCAAGNAMVVFRPNTKDVTPTYIVQTFLEYSTVTGRVAAAAPTQKVYAAFTALKNDAIALSRNKSVIARIVKNPNSSTPPGPLAIREEKDLSTAYVSAVKSAAMECGKKSKFATVATETALVMGLGNTKG